MIVQFHETAPGHSLGPAVLERVVEDPPCELDRGMPLRTLAAAVREMMGEPSPWPTQWRDSASEMLAFVALLVGFDPRVLGELWVRSISAVLCMGERGRGRMCTDLAMARQMVEHARRSHGTVDDLTGVGCPYRANHSQIWRRALAGEETLAVFLKSRPERVCLRDVVEGAGLRDQARLYRWLLGQGTLSQGQREALTTWAAGQSRDWQAEAERARRVFEAKRARGGM